MDVETDCGGIKEWDSYTFFHVMSIFVIILYQVDSEQVSYDGNKHLCICHIC